MNNNFSETFILEEYKNIANTHDKLRDTITLFFNYFLIISAIPYTVLGFINIKQTPDFPFYALFFIIVSIGDGFMALSMYSARLSQYRYAKTVNLIRKYVCDKDKELKSYLYLPTTAEEPNMKDIGYVKYQIFFIIIIALIYFVVGLNTFSIIGLKFFMLILIYFCFFSFLFIRLFKRFQNLPQNIINGKN